MVSRTTRSYRGLPVSTQASVYTPRSWALSYNIFSKCGTRQAASTEYRAKPPPSWSYMPPRAMASRVSVTSRRLSVLPVRWWWARRTASVPCGGNLGAPPNPPLRESKSPRTAWKTTSSQL